MWVGLSNGAGFDPVNIWTDDYSYLQGWRTDLHLRMVGDVNGDGKADAVGYGGNGVWAALAP